MEIIIGRDNATSQLKLSTGGQDVLVGAVGSVPLSVCSEHCKLIINDKGMKLQNLNVNADTYVNGQGIEMKKVTQSDKVELSSDHYLLKWNDVLSIAADIRPLSEIWNDYETQRVKLQIAERRFNSLRSATGLITMAAIALSIMTGRQNHWFILLYAVAILISLGFTIKAYKDASAVPQKTQQLSRQFQRDYVCPQCGHFLGNQSYDILVQNDHCPYCKKQFIH